MRNILLALLSVLVISACGSKESDSTRIPVGKNKETKVFVKKRSFPKTISIYRYGTFSESKALKLEKKLKSYFPSVVLKGQALELPAKHYNKERNRFYAPGLLEDLITYHNNDVIIGLTNYVIFRPNKISPTYGIMGISSLKTFSCVVSSKLAKTGKEHSDENFVKLVLHELGHSYGLHHCPNQYCYMVDAEHKMKFPQTTGFCDTCKLKLNERGWTIP